MHVKIVLRDLTSPTSQIHLSECVSASRLPRECQRRLPALSVLGHCAGEGVKFNCHPSDWDWLADGFPRFLQAFFSSLSGTLATRASLRGVGVGNQEATVAAATMTWLLKGEPQNTPPVSLMWRVRCVRSCFLLQMELACVEESSLPGGKGKCLK